MHGSASDLDFVYSSKPQAGTSRLAERGRRLLNWRKPEADTTDAAQMAVDLAISWEHAESLAARLGGSDAKGFQDEVKQLKENITVFEPEGIVQRLRSFNIGVQRIIGDLGHLSEAAVTAVHKQMRS